MEPANTLDALILKTIIKESVCEVMREEWFKFFEILIPYVDDIEQADIEANWFFGLCYAMDGGYKGCNPYIERHLAIFVNYF
jgi:hypothetical protein